ncbi:maleylpyruvate isomerase family mycothiol-dependent enzyme [Allostreptomyces psammosilenae]|uniref:Uncharacterized protein (TIGR03083 family) n=1 Tax=Allostreptomyces psammosilenae TaxID=1892865 RepID=A0A853A822_9ACTN|nr:maleylpyruvate isomerase family mycothiol-dependent enzyme [Allostreptomyces psammosilenae]NYI06801.1 uncharacterized protein (TIGR03083 family) [Allostreptomyces psammosilenae]
MLDFERCTAGLIAETERLADTVRDAEGDAIVPTCPEWTLDVLIKHVGQCHRWAAAAVRSPEPRMPEETEIEALPVPDEADERIKWLLAGAGDLADALRAAGPEHPVWTWAKDPHARFWARRMLHETLVHRADAAITTGAEFLAPDEITADAVDEFLDNLTTPGLAEEGAEATPAPLRGEGERLVFAIRPAPRAGAEFVRAWTVTLTPDGFTVANQPTAGRFAAADLGPRDALLAGDATALLLAIYRRLPTGAPGVETAGDEELLNRWLTHTAF